MHARSVARHVRLCNPVDCSPPDTSVRGILQARRLEWAAALLQGIFPTPESNPHLLRLLHWQAGSLPLPRLRSLIKMSSWVY